MKIATWNVNSIRVRLPHLLSWLKESQPTVVLLQEIKTQSKDFPYESLEDLGYNVFVFGQKTYNGVAILSKFPLEDKRYGLPIPGWEDTEARYIEAFTAGFRVASVYVPNGQALGSSKYDYKMRFIETLKDHLSHLLTYKEALVVGGDYNIAPRDEDVHDPKRWEEEIMCSFAERTAFQGILDLGLTDAIRLTYPYHEANSAETYTWWDYRGGSWPKNQGLRIDHLLLSPLATTQFQEAGIDRSLRHLEKPSDHAPVWSSFKEIL